MAATAHVGSQFEYRPYDNYWLRFDQCGDETYPVHVASGQDRTPTQRHWQPGQYDSRCGYCYLGASHSQAAHERSICVDVDLLRAVQAIK